MRKLLKWLGILFVGLLGLIVLAGATIFVLTEQSINKTYEFQPEPIVIPTDAKSIDRGRHIATTIGLCIECHGPNLGGQLMENDPTVAILASRNLTRGKGGIGSTYTDEDWVRAIRHGVGSNKKSLVLMASNIYNALSDSDLGALIAYIKSVPPVDNELPQSQIGPVGRFYILAEPSTLPASIIDHAAPRPSDPNPGVTPEYGHYLSKLVCTSCHGEDLAGIPSQGGGLNITLGGEVKGWNEQDFLSVMRTGITPDRKILDAELMPWKQLANMTDDEWKAIWAFIQTVPPVQNTPTPTTK